MEFIDLKDYKIVELHDYFKQTINIDAKYFFDLPLNQADKKIQEALKVGFVGKTVFVQFVFSNVMSLEDFELLVEMSVSAFLDRNARLEKRKKERHTIPEDWKRVNTDIMTLKKAANHNYYNRFVNIYCSTSDDVYRYDLIGKAEQHD